MACVIPLTIADDGEHWAMLKFVWRACLVLPVGTMFSRPMAKAHTHTSGCASVQFIGKGKGIHSQLGVLHPTKRPTHPFNRQTNTIPARRSHLSCRYIQVRQARYASKKNRYNCTWPEVDHAGALRNSGVPEYSFCSIGNHGLKVPTNTW